MLPKSQRSKPVAGPYPNQRSSPRSFVVCPISIATPSGATHGVLRDISASGLFFYSTLKPSLKTNLEFTLTFNDKQISGTGQVVRIEEGVPGAAIGIALMIVDSAVSQL